MNLLHGVGDFFSLDIGTNSMRIVQLSGSGQHGWTLQKYAYVPITQQLTQDSSDLGKKRLGEAILGAVNQAGIKTKNIALGLPASKTFTSIVETETLPEKELAKSFKYEIDKYVPMAMSDAKADYVILGPSPNDPAKTEVLVSSVAKEYAESTMEMIEKTGLNIVAMEPEPLALARALTTPGAIDATMVVDLGEGSTDIVIMYKDKPRLVRSIPGGVDVLIRAVANGLNVRVDQARQFILKFGLDENQVEGQVFKILGTHLDNYAAELAKSVRFFQTKYINGRVGGIVLSSYASMIPLFPEYIEAKTNVPTMRGNPWQFVRTTSNQQRTLANVSSEFAVAIGLSERSND
ncbi:MAG: type IV pilus assembly protein PilM [Candidatus Saccharibacteria bacterium]|uniref:Cell division protein FtsA n=1 Tax=Candidatus Nanosyncoccus alces TaxID=2171997 RepID=A0ABY0FMD6_9BACT|nr:type IV pilus assembly protein PilM [Candidatus Nanosyncoccus alces]MDO4399094.1 type IV pilus assembly protein PilM [Candidatus Saccharibacteria bacterium]RYC75011.1 Cell division protein FtsA [Candidatus Nanosyncoccus alces]